jgi:GTP-binding protein HflX
LGAKEKEILTVFNKVDLLKENDLVNLRISQNYKDGDMVYLSCKSGEGISDLLELIEGKLGLRKEPITYLIPHDKYSLVVKIRKEGCLAKESAEENGMLITAYPGSRLKKELKGFEISY